ncbi:MAG: S9 family peptidase [Flammeovirgaceae bacterium]|jgi:dipeptidyl aminopeptidase/acylaminoacyl peptidase|nr:S9 family peptidase [Flammeovirgaceae bacterium]
MKLYLFLLLVLFSSPVFAQHVPTFEEVISLRSIGSVTLSDDGKHIIYTVQTTDWNENRFDTEIWLSKNGSQPFQLTNTTKGSSSGAEFSPDGKWIAFLADRGNKNQIQIINMDGGEARTVTHEEESISNFEWHPSGQSFIFLKSEKEDKIKREQEKRYGGFEADDKEFTLSHLWQIDFNPDLPDPSELPCYEKTDSLKVKAGCIEWPKARRLTDGKFTVTSFRVSPDGKSVAFGHQPNPLINSFLKSDISLVGLADKKIVSLVKNPSSDGLEDWSPDSKEILFTSNLSDSTSNFYSNSKLFAIQIETKTTRQLAKTMDEDLGGFKWEQTGIYASIWNKTKRHLYRIDPATGAHSVFKNSPNQIYNFSFSKDGQTLAYTAHADDQLNELFVSKLNEPGQQLTDMTGQTKNWKVAQSEVISWKSKDGATIEGVLHKPKDYDPSKRYPLLVMIHGGPTGIDTPTPVPGYVYPVLQWLDKGCLVLRPNYRGSAGYGEAFRSLNVKNLGVGDMWDVLSGIDYLDKKGLIDKTKMGSMGWSQGGYISAFLTTNTDVFKAISVGAGISNWMTYYVNTDIHPFTRQYLKATPWSDEMIYKKTSPITNINKAKTPTLIQHGEFDRRVPIANAYELLQGLRDKNVPAELIVYKGFGHGITKPKEKLAATWHNWQWFNKYIWGEKVELPVGDK